MKYKNAPAVIPGLALLGCFLTGITGLMRGLAGGDLGLLVGFLSFAFIAYLCYRD